jgi:hypothetical protein
MLRIPLSRLAYVVSLVCFPILLLFINDSWVFLRPSGFIDSYIYTGYFLDIKEHLSIFSSTYYGTRLPALLLGSVVHALAARPEIANYVLRLILYYSATFLLFVVVRMVTRNDLAAVIVALLMGSNTYFLWAIGWDYVDGIGIVLILATIAGFTAAASKPNWRLWLVCAGLALASMVYTYIVLILLVPFQIAGYTIANFYGRRNPLAASIMWFGLGVGVATAALGVVNWWLTGQFLFFMPQVRIALGVGANPSQWKIPNYAWVSQAYWLLYPALALGVASVLLGGSVFLLRRNGPTKDLHRLAALFAVLLVGVEVIFLTMELKGFWLLEEPYYASYLIPNSFVCIGIALAFLTSHVRAKWHLAMIGMIVVGALAPFLLSSLRFGPFCQICTEAPVRPWWPYCIGCVLLAASALLKKGWLVVPALAGFGISNVAAADHRIFSFPPSATDRSRSLMVLDAVRALGPFTADGQLRFWYDVKEPLGYVFRGVASTHLWGYRLINEGFPDRTSNPLATGVPAGLCAGETVAILSSMSDSQEHATKSLAQIGLVPQPLGHDYIRRGGEGFQLDFIRLVPADLGRGAALPVQNIVPLIPKAVDKGIGSGVRVHTPPVLWGYAANLPIPAAIHDALDRCSAMIKIHARVERGPVGVGVLRRGGTVFLARQPVRATSGPLDIFLSIESVRDADQMLVQAWDSGKEGMIGIDSITIYPYACRARD